ncbi:MAG: transposase, partial [Treponema sp.]|nr:transposase [Treponema sp.]
WALGLFATVFHETKVRFVFEIRGLRLGDDRLTFYIKPAEGMELPAIMKWLKQVFAQRYNHAQAREGHIWGDRYGSRILEGEPPEGELGGEEDMGIRVRPPYREAETQTAFLLLFPLPLVPAPG